MAQNGHTHLAAYSGKFPFVLQNLCSANYFKMPRKNTLFVNQVAGSNSESTLKDL